MLQAECRHSLYTLCLTDKQLLNILNAPERFVQLSNTVSISPVSCLPRSSITKRSLRGIHLLNTLMPKRSLYF
jgi:hypothetical protein